MFFLPDSFLLHPLCLSLLLQLFLAKVQMMNTITNVWIVSRDKATLFLQSGDVV